jgi:2-iminobutanoate/2-iminopropanoate deaminase
MSNDPDRNTGRPAIAVPGNARQHATAGPYSPVLMVDARRLVVLSGQVAVDLAGQVVGDSIEAQTRATLANCERHLADAGCALSDAFKVNVYLANLDHWGRFNAIYEEVLPPPFPVRTAVQAVLLPGFLVEVEMWAVRAED